VPVMLPLWHRLIVLTCRQIDAKAARRQHQDRAHACQPRNR
jgi:hypothetical protein